MTMKEMIKVVSFIFLVSWVGSITFSSCKRGLETKPLERETQEFIFDEMDSNGTYALFALSNVYGFVPSNINRVGGNLLATLSDDAIPSDPSNAIWQVINGGYTQFYNPDDNWVSMYQAIRAANICYNNIAKVPFKGENTRYYYQAEARLLRAFFYFQLVRRYGGIPLLGDSVRTTDGLIELPRNSFSECIQYIVSECDAAIPSLRPDPVVGSDVGHLGRGAAMALKAEVLLFAASPLNNPDNNLDLWKEAADAAKAVIDLNVFKLEPDFLDIFLDVPNDEMIFYKHVGPSTTVEANNSAIGFPTAVGKGLTSPTQELVDAFGTKNGKPISDPSSGYNPNDPYKDRDPRFYNTILYNGAQWMGGTVETYEGGKDKPGDTRVATLTSYYMRKFMGKFETTTKFVSHNRDFIYIRYAGILLDYAEALNEYQGPQQEVYDQLIAIRKRAGIEAGGDDMYGLQSGMTQEQMRQAIRNERRVELAFEENRYWDIRRWKIAEDVYNQPLHGMKISVYEATGELTYIKVPVATPTFLAPKMYHYPIQYNYWVTNDNLEQSPGW